MPTAKVTKNVSAAIGGGNVLCSTLISIKTKAWLYSFRCKPFLSPINLLHETFSSLCSHIAFGLPDINCVAKVLVMPFLYARSKPDGSRQNLHPPLRTGSI